MTAPTEPPPSGSGQRSKVLLISYLFPPDSAPAPLRRLGFIPQAAGLRYLEETDFLLLIDRDPTASCSTIWPPASRSWPLTPPEGEIARIIRETGSGWVINPASTDTVQEGLLDASRRFQKGEHLVTPRREAAEAFSWPTLSGHLARYTGLDEPARARNKQGLRP